MSAEATPKATAVPPTATPIPPTPTPTEPAAALVNGEPVTLAAYEKELARYEQAQVELGLTPAADYRVVVLNALIERLLITQAAAGLSIVVTPEMVDQKLAELRTAAGDDGNFAAWLEANQWTEEEFRQALESEMVTAEVRDRVTADVPYTAVQVHARYLQVDDAALAASLLEQARSGSDFAALASQYSLDRVTAQAGGDLGFFARGSLLVPEVEDAAFALQPDEISDVVAVTGADGSQTYYLVKTIERDEQRPLTADMRYILLQQTFETWLTRQWEQATIIRLVNADA